jgi:hypothetical protein
MSRSKFLFNLEFVAQRWVEHVQLDLEIFLVASWLDDKLVKLFKRNRRKPVQP